MYPSRPLFSIPDDILSIGKCSFKIDYISENISIFQRYSKYLHLNILLAIKTTCYKKNFEQFIKYFCLIIRFRSLFDIP